MSDTQRTVRVLFDGNTAGLQNASRDAKLEMDSVSASVGNLGQNLAKLGVLGGVAPMLSVIGTTIAQMSGAFLLLPAAITSAVSVFAVADTALSGFEAAVTAASPVAFVAATRYMAPAMQAATNATRALRPELTRLKNVVQQNFWTGFSGEIDALSQTYMPLLYGRFGAISTALQKMRTYAVGALLQPATVTALNTVLQNSATMLTNMGTALGGFLTGFLKLSSAGSGFLPQFGAWIAKIGNEFTSWAQGGLASGRFATDIKAAFSAFHAVGVFWKQIFDIFKSIIDALAGGTGATGLGVINNVLTAVHDFVSSTGAQNTLSTIGAALRQIGVVLVTVIASGLKAVAPILVALSPIAVALAQDFGTVLLAAFAQLTPQVVALINQLAPILIPALATLANILSTVIIPVISELVKLISDAVSVIGSFIDGITGVSTAATSAGTAISGATSGSSGSTSSSSGWFSSAIAGAGNFLSNLFGGLAAGGPATSGHSYLVGENGAEVLTMGGNGFVSPLGAAGGDTHVHVKIGDTELNQIVSHQIVKANRGVARTVRSGRGSTL